MLRIYGVVLEVVKNVKPTVDAIERRIRISQADATGCGERGLNVSEGMYSQGRNRRARYHNAMGSMRETLACIEVGEALG